MIGGCARAAPGGTSRPEFTKSDIERVLEQLLLERDASPHPGGRLRRGLPGGALTRTGKETLFTLLRRRLGLAVDTLVMVRIDREPGSASALLPFIAEPPDRDPARDFVALVVRPGAALRAARVLHGHEVTGAGGLGSVPARRQGHREPHQLSAQASGIARLGRSEARAPRKSALPSRWAASAAFTQPVHR